MNRNIGLLTLSMALVLTLAGCSGSNAPGGDPRSFRTGGDAAGQPCRHGWKKCCGERHA